MTHSVRRACRADTKAVADLLVRSFAEDPFVGWVVAEDPGRRKRYVDLVLETLTLPHDHVYVTEALSSAALWAPPGAWDLGLTDQLRLVPAAIAVVGLRRLFEVARVAEEVERGRPAAYWYLALLGTVPEARGRGAASALLRPVLAQADAAALPALLETAVERNIGFYARFGFEVVREIEIHGGPTLWAMRRDPR